MKVIFSIVSAKPTLKKCLVKCKHCQIPFIGYPCNAGRKDLGCPFGCQKNLRGKNSKQRSCDFYRSQSGKFKKKRLNARRASKKSSAIPCGSSTTPPEAIANFQATMVYLQTVVSLVEGRQISLSEVFGEIQKFVRQRSLDGGIPNDYSKNALKKDPP